MLAYWPSLRLPFISDDYLQIRLGREYGPVSGWASLLNDALYRTRATSLVMTYWTERIFGLIPFVFNLSSLALHIVNSILVFALGFWRPVGWRAAAIGACFFAVSQRHHEAVMWYSALPELLVFFFSILSLLCWIWWLQSGRAGTLAYWGALLFFFAGLFSKESAVAVGPLLLMAGAAERVPWRVLIVRLAPFAVVSALYFAGIYAARDTHLHFNDAGTFSLGAPFPTVILKSTAHLYSVWGALAVLALATARPAGWKRILVLTSLWTVIALLPYSFLTYMKEVPSRHTYLASASLALLIGAAALAITDLRARRGWRVVLPLIACGFVVHEVTYLWTRKQAQFEARAWPTEQLLSAYKQTGGPLVIRCFPYDPSVAELALEIAVGEAAQAAFVAGPEAEEIQGSLDLCGDPGSPPRQSHDTGKPLRAAPVRLDTASTP